MNWFIEPLTGVGPLRFGMEMKEVHDILDATYPVTNRFVEFDGSTSEHRGLGVPVCSYNDKGKLRGVDTNHTVRSVKFGDCDIYLESPKKMILMLEKINGGVKYGVGILLFENVSITTNGFFRRKEGFYRDGFDNQQDERTVSIYELHAFEAVMSSFRSISLKKY